MDRGIEMYGVRSMLMDIVGNNKLCLMAHNLGTASTSQGPNSHRSIQSGQAFFSHKRPSTITLSGNA
jgi:hypothetical protein